MAGTAAIAVASIVGGAVLSKAMAPDIPNPGTPEKPADMQGADAEAKKKQGQQRRTAAASSGREGTLLTGPQGLGEVSTANQQKQTLLGY